jgi:WD40 repeat protein/serine/threonine protein kinase
MQARSPNQPAADAPPSGATAADARYPANTAGMGAPDGAAPTKPHPASDVLPELRDHAQYEVIRELGRGGMGVVYLARNKLMDRLEVLKVVNKQLLGNPGAAERFLREIRSAAKLSHPNIVTAHSALPVGELLVFAMEYVEGENLAQVVQANGWLPVANACYYAHQVTLGLQHAFEKGMVHRDIKPQNLILARENKKHIVKILDFGLAKATREGEEADRGLTGTGAMLGTPDYIAPEQTLDAARADIRADIYSLGCTLHYLLAGSPPFKGNSQFELLQAHHMKDATPLNQIRADVPPELANVVAKMMAKDPARRYQKPVEVAQALAPFVKAPTKSVPPASPGDRVAATRGAPSTATPPSTGTVIEGSATIARAAAVAAAAPTTPPGPTPGTVVEGSATIAHAMKKTAERTHVPPAGRSRESSGTRDREEEYEPIRRPKKSKTGLIIGIAAAAVLLGGGCCVSLSVLPFLLPSKQTSSPQPVEADRGKGDPKGSDQAGKDADGSDKSGGQVPLPSDPPVARIDDEGSAGDYDLTGGFRFVHFGPDGPQAILRENDSTGRQYFAQVYDMTTGKPLCPPFRHTKRVQCAAFSLDGKRVVTGSEDNTAQVWDVATNQALCEPLKHTFWVTYAAFSPNGKLVVTCSDQSARIWDIETNRPGAMPAKPFVSLTHTATVHHALFSPDGTRVVTSSWDKTARVWDARTGQAITPPLLHGAAVRHAAFSPDGKWVATASEDWTARVWNAATGEAITPPLKHGEKVSYACFSPNGKQVVTASYDKTARVWDAATGKALYQPLSHNQTVGHAVFSPGGKRVLTTGDSSNGTGLVWDPATGKQLSRQQDLFAVWHACFSPDGKRAVTTSFYSYSAWLWDAETGKVIKLVNVQRP